MIDLYYPLRSLREGNWFKLICGASFQHLPAVRSLTLAYALAGADCVDIAADPAVAAAAQDGLRVAKSLAREAQLRGYRSESLPWLMISLNDGEDPHFRKAVFDPATCPDTCPRPCETICPARAIVFEPPADSIEARLGNGFSGVVESHCYGCGRCLPICPEQKISTYAHASTSEAIASLLLTDVDAVEIHTQVGRFSDFKRLWESTIAPVASRLKLIAISCPDGEGLIEYLWALSDLISSDLMSNQAIASLSRPLIWQTDGRPMSGDIGDGATRSAVKLGQKVLAAGLPGYVQLAGGTNSHTVPKLEAIGLLKGQHLDPLYGISGVAFGSYARVLLAPVLSQLEAQFSPALEDTPELLWQAVALAHSLISPLKTPMQLRQTIPK
ncbi:MAG: 4Fe-4S ferredoxin [Oscillatoriophycideae cyanobacterium NC_groundwater_1537_Pr4_S-0.65um_50_18]|nr:4Fe-4S ferredoxin [Oscillatoriophycideae cyanobacterium NC_groundwater_1537_Pr4_S-0.65um_50_18]